MSKLNSKFGISFGYVVAFGLGGVLVWMLPDTFGKAAPTTATIATSVAVADRVPSSTPKPKALWDPSEELHKACEKLEEVRPSWGEAWSIEGSLYATYINPLYMAVAEYDLVHGINDLTDAGEKAEARAIVRAIGRDSLRETTKAEEFLTEVVRYRMNRFLPAHPDMPKIFHKFYTPATSGYTAGEMERRAAQP